MNRGLLKDGYGCFLCINDWPQGTALANVTLSSVTLQLPFFYVPTAAHCPPTAAGRPPTAEPPLIMARKCPIGVACRRVRQAFCDTQRRHWSLSLGKGIHTPSAFPSYSPPPPPQDQRPCQKHMSCCFGALAQGPPCWGPACDVMYAPDGSRGAKQGCIGRWGGAPGALEQPQQLPSRAAEREGAADREGAATRRLHIHLCKPTGSGYVVDWVNAFSVPLSCVLRVVARGWLCDAGEVRMPEEVRWEVCAMLMAEEEGHTCLLRALGSIGRGEFTEAKALLQRVYFRGCALAHMHCIWAALWSVKGQPDKALQSLEDAVRAGLDWHELVPWPPTRPTAPVAQAPHTPAAGSPAMAPSAGSSSGPDIPEGPAPAPVDDVRLLPGLLEHLGSIRGHPDFSELAQRATSRALPWAPAERVMGYAAEEDNAEDDDNATTVVFINPPAPDARAKSRSGVSPPPPPPGRPAYAQPLSP